MRSASSRHSRGPSSRICPFQLDLRGQEDHREAEDEDQRERQRQIGARRRQPLRPGPPGLAHPVGVGQQRDRAADAADERQRVGDRERRTGAKPRPVRARPQHDQQHRRDDGDELQADEPLDDGEKALVAAEPHHRHRGHGVDEPPDRQRHARHDGGRHQRAGGDERARDEVAPDDEVEEERGDDRASAAPRASPR